MDPKALKKVNQQIIKAQRAFDRLCATQDSDETMDAWDDFLTAFGKVYFKLGEGAKVNGPSSGWFERKKKFRKDDPLLSYVHQARNSETHGIDDTGEEWFEHSFVGDSNLPFIGLRVPKGGLVGPIMGVLPNGERVPLAAHKTPSVRLVTVYDKKHGVSFGVPTHHLGMPLTYAPIPAYIAGTALEYLKNLLDEAWSRVQ